MTQSSRQQQLATHPQCECERSYYDRNAKQLNQFALNTKVIVTRMS